MQTKSDTAYAGLGQFGRSCNTLELLHLVATCAGLGSDWESLFCEPAHPLLVLDLWPLSWSYFLGHNWPPLMPGLESPDGSYSAS